MSTSTGPTPNKADLPGGRLLAGRYQIGKLLGRGGMADVHIGTDTRLGRTVAIKLMKSSLADDPAFRTRFRQEAQAAARMAHPTIVRVFDAGEETVLESSGAESQLPFIVMEYVDGKLLKDLISAGPLEVAEAAHIIEGILTALEYSHRAGVVHRDIKPGNIMITRAGQVKVMDFGIARAISDSSATVAQTSAILGTAQYFSPEQARGESVDARTDLYSTGIVLFEMLTGRPPFRGDTPVSVAYQHVSEQPPLPSAINPDLTPAIDTVVLHALAKDRFERFQSAADFRGDVKLASLGQLPKRKLPSTDTGATLFGAPPSATAGREVALKQLAVDDSSVVRTQNRPPAVWIWAGILSIAVIVAAVVFWVLSLTPAAVVPPTTRIIPVVSGETYDAVEQQLLGLDLVPRQQTEPSDSVAEGQVTRTDPGDGSKVAPDTVVDVYVSSGPTRGVIPDLRGMDEEDARQKLQDNDYQVGSISREHSPTLASGVVLRSDPDGETEVELGERVDLVISDGKVQLPDVTGSSLDDARDLLESSDLQLRVRVDTPTAQCDQPDVVLSQSEPPGAIDQRSIVRLTVCAPAVDSTTAPAAE